MGSSPLTRGKRGRWPHKESCAGLIPAHAGKTTQPSSPLRIARAHPRSRGENAASGWALRPWAGSSPLTRGKHVNSELCPHGRGLIPAHAGKTYSQPWPPSHPWAHPRSRGENVGQSQVLDLIGGSSPLTRGKLLRRDYRRHVRGLIPAHAGKTWPRPLSSRARPAHPRSRGENEAMAESMRRTRGSSPLTRGKPG